MNLFEKERKREKKKKERELSQRVNDSKL